MPRSIKPLLEAHERNPSGSTMDVELSNFERLDTDPQSSAGWTSPTLDPESPSFNSTEWFKKLAELKSSDRSTHLPKRGGFFFRNLDVYGVRETNAYLQTFGNAPIRLLTSVQRLLGRETKTETKILHGFEGFVNSGEMLAVLGRPGSGCTTVLKTLAGETRGLRVGANAEVLYQGIPPETMHSEFRGECIYTAEEDVHFSELTVLETLRFAAASRAPKNLLPGMDAEAYIEHVSNVVLSIFNLATAKNTPIGDALIRGVSGGEKKRVSIAESYISFAPVQFWDNSTRGMDSATALDCIRSFQTYTRTNGASIAVSLYQASQDILDCFDKVTVLYDGRQIFFGTWQDAIDYFQDLGFEKPPRLTTGDFLTSLTNPQEAKLLLNSDRSKAIPITADDFADAWHRSIERQKNLQCISDLRDEFQRNVKGTDAYRRARALEKHPGVGSTSPYTIPLLSQTRLCLSRGFRRLRNNIAVPISYVIGNLVMAFIIGSIYYDLGATTDDVTKRSVLLFFAILINAFMSAAEVLTVWDQRPIVEKQTNHSFYHPVAEAISAIICDFPAKLTASLLFNLALYLMSNLRRTPESFFTFWFFTFACQLAMSMFFRCDGSIHRTLEASMVPVGVLVMLATIYTGYVIPVPYMKPWLAWFRHINPVAYAFESLMINEFHGRKFSCSRYIPDGPTYADIPNDNKACLGASGLASKAFEGDDYIQQVYSYQFSHLWRNLGVILAFLIFFATLHLWSSEKVETAKPKGDVLTFLRGHVPKMLQQDEENDLTPSPENQTEVRITSDAGLVKHKSTMQWENVSYEVPLKKGTKKILTDVDGWVRPGTLTALMGATGAGKTTLLDVLAQRTTTGTITGDILMDARQRDSSFQRTTGYAQQNDLHLPTATVREALEFSALLRQPRKLPKAMKLAYAERIINLLGIEHYADAVIGVPGDGISPEQRKRLTIALELASRPSSVLFLDEPTSGLDSQTAFIICNLLRNLAHESRQAIMCTIHQPSSRLLDMFDRLLLIDKGQTIYFGPVGRGMGTIIDYFEKRGAPPCRPGQNPAEWIMEITGASPGFQNNIDWQREWNASPEKQQVKQQLSQLKVDLAREERLDQPTGEFATSIWTQLRILTHRTFIEYWRKPAAIYAKMLFYIGASFMIGVSCFRAPTSLQGLQNLLFSIFLMFTTFSNVLQQIAPQFGARRALFEARERPSKIFDWRVFIASSIIVEAAWQILLAMLSWALFYYLTGMHLNTSPDDKHERAGLMLLFFIAFFLFTESLSHLLAVAIEVPQTAVNMGQPIFYLTIIFCGVLVPRQFIPKFWIFMYYMSPLTYLTRGMYSVGIAHKVVQCTETELVNIPISSGNGTCREYLEAFIKQSGGMVTSSGTENCQYCPMKDTDEFLGFFAMNYEDRWRDFAIVLIYIIFNWIAIFGLYWLARVPKRKSSKEIANSDQKE